MLKIQFCCFLFLGIMVSSCSRQANTVTQTGNDPKGMSQPGPHVIIYKTSADYISNIPVTLSPDKKSVVNYPGPGDVYFKGELAYPTKLSGGFLLDHRGIGLNSAFTSYKYDEYSRFDKAPPTSELLKHVIDADPFTEMYDCGSITKYRDVVSEINQLIDQGDFSSFTKIR